MTSPASTFSTWTGGRQIASIGTNDGAPALPFQTWHRFKEAFAPELIAQAIRTTPRPISSCFDPFGGSGTTALACQMLGVGSETIEVNPFLADVIAAKLALYDVDELARTLSTIRRLARRSTISAEHYFRNMPPTFLEPGVNGRWIFNADVALHLARLLSTIDDIEDPANRRLFRVLLGGILTDVSNVVVSGKGRRYRRGWQNNLTSGDDVNSRFSERVKTAILDIQAFATRPTVTTYVANGDARVRSAQGLHELSVFSPPYPNSFDYTDVYNLELWVLGYLNNAAQNRVLRQSTLSSHVQVTRNYSDAPPGSPTLDSIRQQLEDVRLSLWNRHIPTMLGAYFADLLRVVSNVRESLTPAGSCWIVVGDSRYAGISVPVGRILRELVEGNGWVVDQDYHSRHMKSSAQQGWLPELAETLLVLQRS